MPTEPKLLTQSPSYHLGVALCLYCEYKDSAWGICSWFISQIPKIINMEWNEFQPAELSHILDAIKSYPEDIPELSEIYKSLQTWMGMIATSRMTSEQHKKIIDKLVITLKTMGEEACQIGMDHAQNMDCGMFSRSNAELLDGLFYQKSLTELLLAHYGNNNS